MATRRLFERVAESVRLCGIEGDEKDTLISYLCADFAAENSRFDAVKFRAACERDK